MGVREVLQQNPAATDVQTALLGVLKGGIDSPLAGLIAVAITNGIKAGLQNAAPCGVAFPAVDYLEHDLNCLAEAVNSLTVDLSASHSEQQSRSK
jgi:NH3-dependent NAD+ synthetase